jgi:hypothetical protein
MVMFFYYNDSLLIINHVVERPWMAILVIGILYLMTYGETMMTKLREAITAGLITNILLCYLGIGQAAGVELTASPFQDSTIGS